MSNGAEQALAAAVVTGVVELIKLAPELEGIIARGLEGADDNSPIVPKLREIMPAPGATELAATVARLEREQAGK